jgi:hypothetical protein
MIFISSIILITFQRFAESTKNDSVQFKTSQQSTILIPYHVWLFLILTLLIVVSVLIFLLKNGLFDKICFIRDNDNFSEVIFDLENKKEKPPMKIVITKMDENIDRFKQKY